MVRLEHITKIYEKGEKAVDDVSLEVKKGEIVMLVGPSGCGKTTTLKMINRLIPLTEGKIFVNDQDIEKVDPVILRRGIGYVIQQIGLMPHLTIQENISYVLQLMKYKKTKQKERAEELIKIVGLPDDYLKKYPRQLSGGQQQRIGVARALAADPDLILMDEPFGALDPITREQLQQELLRLQEQLHKTIIFVTHDMQEAFKIGTTVVIMKNGKIETMGDAMSLTCSCNQFVQDFLGRKAVFDALDTIPVSRILDKNVSVVQVDQKWEDTREKTSASWEFTVVVNNKGEFMGVKPTYTLEPGMLIGDEGLCTVDEFIPENFSIQQAIESMLRAGRSWVPVQDASGKFQGLVTFDTCSRKIQ